MRIKVLSDDFLVKRYFDHDWMLSMMDHSHLKTDT